MKLIKYLIIVLASFFALSPMQAQLPDGAIAPDWTLTDLNGVEHNLYTYLNAGKSVIIDFSATWCGPCWSYHNTGILEELYNTYGPPGTGEIMVFFLEGDINTNDACLYGNTAQCSAGGGSTQGNWVAGTPYPIINIPASQQSVVNSYAIGYWPTLYAICADTKKTYEVGQQSFETWESWVIESCQLGAIADILDADCYMQGSIDLTTIEGYGNKSYQWNTGQTTEDLTNIGPGTYWVTITDQHNYTYTSPQYVVEGTTIPFDAMVNEGEPITCFGGDDGSLVATPIQGSPPYTYDWSDGSSGHIAYDLEAGDYEVTVTDAFGCEVVESFNLAQPSEVELVYDVVNTTCELENGELFLSGVGGTGSNYMFDIGDGFSSQNHYTDLPYGVYYIDIIDGNDCLNSEFVYIEFGPNPVADAGPNAALDCENPEVILDGSGSTQGSHMIYTWETINGNIVSGENTLTPVVNEPGNYLLTVENGLDGCIVTDEVVVTLEGVAPVVTGDAPESLTCDIVEVTLDATGSDSGANFEISWSTNDGNIVSGANTLTPTVDQPGTYTLTINNINSGCSTSMDFVVTSNANLPVFNTPSQTLTCSVSEVEICVVPVSNVQNIIWEDNEEGFCRVVSQSGQFNFTAVGNNGCETTGFIEVVADASLPTASAGDGQTLTCLIQTLTLDGSASSQGDDFTYLWTTETGNIVSDPDQLIITVDAPGTYVLSVTNTTNGCTNAAQVIIEEFINTPDAAFTNEVAYNMVSVFAANGSQNGTSVWTASDGQQVAGNVATFVFNVSGNYEICHTYTNECGSAVVCQTVTVVILPLGVNQAVENLLCNADQSGSITLVPTGGIPGYSVSWEGPEGFSSTEFSLTGLQAGSYTYTITDNAGSTFTEVINITEPAPLEVTVVITDETNGQLDGGLDITVHGGTPPYTYSWSNGAVVEDLAGLAAGEYVLYVTDANGCIFETVFTVDSKTNTENPKFVNMFMVMPNPAITEVSIKVSMEKNLGARLYILNQLGQKIDIKTIGTMESETKLDISQYTQGIYFIRLETETGSVTQKMIKL